MTKRANRSSSLRKIFYRTPAGSVRIKYKRRTVSKASCAQCRKKLAGRRPGRKYSKTLCPACTRLTLLVKTGLRRAL